MEKLKRQRVSDLLTKDSTAHIGEMINVKGWIRTKRGNKNVAFLALNDGSIIHNIQIVVDVKEFENDELLKNITTGSCVSVTGKLIESQGAGQKYEIAACM